MNVMWPLIYRKEKSTDKQFSIFHSFTFSDTPSQKSHTAPLFDDKGFQAVWKFLKAKIHFLFHLSSKM